MVTLVWHKHCCLVRPPVISRRANVTSAMVLLLSYVVPPRDQGVVANLWGLLRFTGSGVPSVPVPSTDLVIVCVTISTVLV